MSVPLNQPKRVRDGSFRAYIQMCGCGSAALSLAGPFGSAGETPALGTLALIGFGGLQSVCENSWWHMQSGS
jgi:hypothetical protein